MDAAETIVIAGGLGLGLVLFMRSRAAAPTGPGTLTTNLAPPGGTPAFTPNLSSPQGFVSTTLGYFAQNNSLAKDKAIISIPFLGTVHHATDAQAAADVQSGKITPYEAQIVTGRQGWRG